VRRVFRVVALMDGLDSRELAPYARWHALQARHGPRALALLLKSQIRVRWRPVRGMRTKQ
jgi:hypothetical protein